MSRVPPYRRSARLACLAAAALLTAPVAAAPPFTAEIDALGGALPPDFDVYPADPCAGAWTAYGRDGRVAAHVMVIRWRGTPLLSIGQPGQPAMNVVPERVDQHTLRMPSTDLTITVRCRPGAEHLLIRSQDGTTMLPLRATP